MRKGSEGEGKGRKGTHNVGDVAVPLKLVADVAARLGAGPGVGDVPRAAQDGAVEGEDAGALEELLSGGGLVTCRDVMYACVVLSTERGL